MGTILRHISHTLLLPLLASFSLIMPAAAEDQDCLREFPALFTLHTGLGGETREQRLAQTHNLVAVKLKGTPESVAKKLPMLVDALRKDAQAPKLERARAEFAFGAYAEAQVLALEAGDEAHRSTPRRPDQVISALELAAFAALEQARYEDAVKFLNVALGEASPERNLPVWTQLQSATARAYGRMKMLKNEEQIVRHIYTEHDRLLGANHAETIKHQSELAGLLYQHGHDAEAERETRAVLAATEKLHGPQSEQTQIVRKNLARVLEVLGRQAEAEALRRAVVTTQVQTLGGGAAGTLRSREQLIKNLFAQKKHAEAEVEARTLLEHSERALGPDSVTSITSRISLALAVSEQGRHEESLKLLRALQEDAARTLGADHVDTLRVRHALGACLNALKEYAEAGTLLSLVLDVRKRVLPADDLATLETRHQLGIALLKQGRLKEALAEIRITSIAYQRLLKADDPRSLAVNQTSTEFANSKEGKQVLMNEQLDLVAEQAKKLGEDSVAVLNLRLNAAVFLNTLGSRDESLAEYQKTLNGCIRTLGLKHLGTVDVMQKMGLQQLSMGKFAEAEKTLRQALDLRQKLVKPGDLSVEETRYHLGVCLGQMGRIKESHELVEKCYLAAKDRTEANAAFVQQIKSVLDQLTQMLAGRTAAPPPAQSAAATIQQPIQISPQKSATAPMTVPGTVNSSMPGMNPSSLVPAGTIQKPLEFKP